MSYTTKDLSKFGSRERAILIGLLTAWQNQGLPADFEDSDVEPMMNSSSGNVFLTNSDYQVAMMNGEKLESFYSTGNAGHEGFLDDLLDLDPHHIDVDDVQEIIDIADNVGRELPENWLSRKIDLITDEA